jgi:hypothetical protein
MTKRFEQFLSELPEEEQTAIAQETERLLAEEMTLQQLRKAAYRHVCQHAAVVHSSNGR